MIGRTIWTTIQHCRLSKNTQTANWSYYMLKEWSKRKHSNKGLSWIKNKYFKVIETRKWCFAVPTKNKGIQGWKELFQATNVPIRRHKKARAIANPYDNG